MSIRHLTHEARVATAARPSQDDVNVVPPGRAAGELTIVSGLAC